MTCRRSFGDSIGRNIGRQPKLAFTLIELLAVITIIGILSGIVIGVGRYASATGKGARAKVELAAISSALEGYKRQYGDYPRTDIPAELLQALVGKLGPSRNALSPQGRVLLDLALFTTDDVGDPLSKATLSLADPWGSAYRYHYFANAGQRTYILYSIGPDSSAIAPLSLSIQNRDEAANLDNIYANF